MKNEHILKVILAPLFTEKTYRLSSGAHQQLAFEVATHASKADIKAAVEQFFEVKVENVRTVVMKGKKRRFGQIVGRTQDWKKAYVRLSEGSKIDFGGTEA